MKACETAHNTSMSNHKFDGQTLACSIDHLLEPLHWQRTHSLGSWLGLEDAWLLGEWVDALACCNCWLLLELQVQAATNLELAVLLELSCSQLHVACYHSLDVLWLQLSGLGNLSKCGGCCDASTGCCLLHCLHSWSHDANDEYK